MKEYIICSAIYFNDDRPHLHQPVNILTGFVVCGRRHHNCYATLVSIGKNTGLDLPIKNMIHKIDRENQGFITNTNRYVDREEAMRIAKKSQSITQSRLT